MASSALLRDQGQEAVALEEAASAEEPAPPLPASGGRQVSEFAAAGRRAGAGGLLTRWSFLATLALAAATLLAGGLGAERFLRPSQAVEPRPQVASAERRSSWRPRAAWQSASVAEAVQLSKADFANADVATQSAPERAAFDGDPRQAVDGDPRQALVTAADYALMGGGEDDAFGESGGGEVEASGGEEEEDPFDCDAGLNNWEAGWSEDKKDWCCANEQKGCEEEPFDCDAGLNNADAGWSQDKKEWCCANKQKGCQEADLSQYYDCSVAFDDWRDSWPAEKKEYCCRAEQKGCEEGTSVSGSEYYDDDNDGDDDDDAYYRYYDDDDDDDDGDDDGPDYAKMDIPKNAWGIGWESLLITNIAKPRDCRRVCAGDLRCKSWLWRDELGGTCRLRDDRDLAKRGSGAEGASVKEVRGLVTHTATTTTTTATTSTNTTTTSRTTTWTRTTTASTTTTAFKGTSMFCWAVVRPDTYEVPMVRMQHQIHTGLFECDGYSVFSNKPLNIARGFNSTTLDVDLNCKIGGEFNSPLNIEPFLAAWQRVFEDGLYGRHDWTVKVDVDAVFLPKRLRYVLLQYPDTYPRGIYFVNCQYGLHGPIEVFSLQAVQQWSMGWQTCRDEFLKMCNGPCTWGEDMFVDQCLKRVLKVERKVELTLLMEENCNADSGWEECRDDSHVAFHPFKSVRSYQECLNHTSAFVS